MGRSKKIGHAKRHQNKRNVKVKISRKVKDIDEIHADMQTSKRTSLLNQPLDHDLPGKGQHYCISCGKYFVDENTLKQHMKTKQHKRRLKRLQVEPYSQAEADRAAGMGSYVAPKRVEVKDQDVENTAMEDTEDT